MVATVEPTRGRAQQVVRDWRDRPVAAGVVRRSGFVIAILVAGVLCVVPMIYVFSFSLRDGADGLRRMLADRAFPEVLWNTVYLALGSMLLSMFFGTCLAWFAYRLPPGRRWMGILPMAPLILPQLPLIIAFTFLLTPRVGYVNELLRSTPLFDDLVTGPLDVYGGFWIIFVTGLLMTSFVFLFVSSGLNQLNVELIDAAAASGIGPVRVFLGIVIPLIRPALLYAAATVLLLCFGQFTAPLIYGTNANISVLTSEMYHRTQVYPVDYPIAASYGLPILCVGLLFLFGQRLALREPDRFVMSSSRGRRPISANGWVAQLSLIVYGLLTTVLPLGALITVAVAPFWTGRIEPTGWTLRHFRTVLGRDDLTQAISNSIFFALVTVVIVVPLAYFVASLLYHRAKSPLLAKLLDVVVNLPLGIPSVLFGVGFLLFYTSSPLPLYGRSISIILVYVTIMLTFAVRIVLVAMMNLGGELTNAAATCGAGPLRRALTVEVPMLRSALAGAAALVVVFATHEFSASVLVRNTQTEVMGTILFTLFNYGSYSETAVYGLVMFAVTGVGVMLALLIGRTTESHSRKG